MLDCKTPEDVPPPVTDPEDEHLPPDDEGVDEEEDK